LTEFFIFCVFALAHFRKNQRISAIFPLHFRAGGAGSWACAKLVKNNNKMESVLIVFE